MRLRLYHLCRLLLITGVASSLMACLGLQGGTVSNNPVAVPTELSGSPANMQGQILTPLTTDEANNSNDAALFAQLQSADQKLNNSQYSAAEQQLTQLRPLLNSPALKTNLTILQVKLALLTGQPEKAMTYLNNLLPAPSLSASQQHYLMQLRIQTLYRTNQVLLSAIANIQDTQLLDNTTNSSENDLIWTKLLTIDPATLQSQKNINPQPLVTGWVSLAQIAQNNANNFEVLQQTLLTWQQNYPKHPANTLLAQMNNDTKNQTNIGAIAVILPLTGSYAALGQEVQKGILAAYYTSPLKTQQRIEFFDSNTDSISKIYQHIQENGDQVILGPLTKENTEDLLDIAQPSPRIISLNYTSNNLTNTTHFEFGLSPETEAQQAAALAWRQGKNQAIIIAPKTDKGEQTAEAFTTAWTALGGQIVEQYHYAINDIFSKSISALLGATDSKWRQHQLHTTLQLRITGNTYVRKDADMIFLIADPKTARQIEPFIKFYGGNQFSVFATSSVYSDTNSIGKDKDLNDVYFCDMPGMLSQKIEGNRLYFLGKDAYLLAMQQSHLNTLPRFPLLGTTGHLTVDLKHNIQRELVCAKFKDGRPSLLNSTR